MHSMVHSMVHHMVHDMVHSMVHSIAPCVMPMKRSHLPPGDDGHAVLRLVGEGDWRVVDEHLGCHGTQYVRHTGAGRRTAYVQYWAPRGQLPCTSGTYSTQEAGTRSPYVQYEGPGAYM